MPRAASCGEHSTWTSHELTADLRFKINVVRMCDAQLEAAHCKRVDKHSRKSAGSTCSLALHDSPHLQLDGSIIYNITRNLTAFMRL